MPATSRSPARRAARTCGSCSCARRGGARGVAVALLEAAVAAAPPRATGGCASSRRATRRAPAASTSARASRHRLGGVRGDDRLRARRVRARATLTARMRGKAAWSASHRWRSLLLRARRLGGLERRREGRRARHRRNGALLMYRGTGSGGFVPSAGQQIGSRLGLVHRAARDRVERRRQARTCSRATPTARC